MNLQDRVIYRCIHAACARTLPREVNFCPYCGTGQHAGVTNPAHVARPVQAAYREAIAPTPPPVPAAPVPPPAAAPVLAKPAPVAAAVPAPSPAPPAPPAPPAAPPAAAAPARPAVAKPPKREPIRLRWWLVALGTLWLIWLYAKPSPNKIEARIESAMLANAECRLNDAQSELIALRMTKATPKQLEDLQKAINKASTVCGKKEARANAWTETSAAVETALGNGDFAKAQSRLTQFTRRWNDDEATRKLKEKIASQRSAAGQDMVVERVEPVDRLRSDRSQSARNLIDEAERAIAAGNYQSASDKLETCVTMADEGNSECAAFKVHADRLLREQQRCLSAGRIWSQEACR